MIRQRTGLELDYNFGNGWDETVIKYAWDDFFWRRVFDEAGDDFGGSDFVFVGNLTYAVVERATKNAGEG